jgi:hypothetical protein
VWRFEVEISIGQMDPLVVTSRTTWPDREGAIGALKAAVKDLMLETCHALGAPKPDGVINLLEGTSERWDDWQEDFK